MSGSDLTKIVVGGVGLEALALLTGFAASTIKNKPFRLLLLKSKIKNAVKLPEV